MPKQTRSDLVEELIDAARAMQSGTDAMDQAAADYLGINRTDLACLDVIERTGPITAGDLAEATRLTTGAVTTVLDRLEKAGYAKRVRDKEDRRRVLVQVTPKLRRAGEGVWGYNAIEGRKLLEQLTDEEMRLITEFLRQGRELNMDSAARVRALAERKSKRRKS